MANAKESTSGAPRIVEQADLADVARQVRTEAGLTQQETADRLGVAKSSISRVERFAGGRYLNLQRRILSEIGGYRLRGPLWEIIEDKDEP